MFVPVHDYNPIKTIPFQFVTVSLIVLNVVIFVATSTHFGIEYAASFAVVPGELLSEGVFGPANHAQRFDFVPVPEIWTLVSYMFLHGDILHLAGNMLFLWVFGDNVEDAMGHLKFLLFYLAAGIFAGLMHTWMIPHSPQPLIGASGAVAGVVAAYLMLHPRVTLWVLVMRVLPVKVAAFWALGAWVVMQFVLAFVSVNTPVAWWAHVGGLLAGAVLIVFMRRQGVFLFDRPPSQI